MVALMTGPMAPIVAFALACMAAWKAAELLEASNFLAAVAVGAAFALIGPFLLDDIVMMALADLTPAGDQEDDLNLCVPRIGLGLTRVGFALMGVLAWCGIERTA